MTPHALFDMPAAQPAHPAKYTDALLLTMAQMLKGSKRICDPFCGTGKIFLLEHWLGDVEIQGTEIEPEWAAKHPKTTLGNALHLPWADGYFDAVCTSPTYGNRMADTLPDSEEWQRQTYTAKMGRPLHADNSGSMQWGDEYKWFHMRAWREAYRVLGNGGVFVLNIKDHIRNGKTMHVTEWHIGLLEGLGFRLVDHAKIVTPSMRYGQNGDARVPYESVILFRLDRVNVAFVHAQEGAV